ncbi:MAG: DUF167 domain-containing protein [Thermoprotei archaeon]|nr:MAG: DUF167 domain-containing protein [Thermoprotei archaeon]
MSKELEKTIINNITETKDGVILSIHVKPDSDKEELRIEGGDLVFHTREPPIHGRANASLIRFLARTLGVPISKIDIIYGLRGRFKRIKITDTTVDTIVKVLLKYFEKSS